MTPIKDYIWIVFLQNPASAKNLPQHFITREEFELHAMQVITESLNAGGYPDHEANGDLAAQFFEGLQSAGALNMLDDDLAETFFQVDTNKANGFRTEELSKSSIHSKSQNIGPERYFGSAFERFYRELWNETETDRSSIPVPASDRVVTLTDNQVKTIDTAASTLITEVEHVNGIDGDPSLKSRIVGQLKAGLELVRAGTLNAYLLHQTMMSVLGALIVKYKGHAIGEAARVLFALLIEHVLIGN